jgi:Icc-related predicted phosphoesterase
MLRLAAVGDVHVGADSVGHLRDGFASLGEEADVLLLAGDLTKRGELAEADVLAGELRDLPVPIIAVLGNHDYESAKVPEVTRILCDAGIHVLDGTSFEVHGVGFAGVKGFAGGFGRRALGPWGEEVVKLFVQEALNEALKLETALARLRTAPRIVLMHYSPIEATVEGEPKEIYPYLGSSRLEEPLTRYPVDAVFHGHAHHGAAEGRTRTGVPVYNVSMHLMQRERPDGPPFRFLDLPVTGSAPD